MDRQQTTGFILLTAMLIAYFFYFGEPPAPPQQEGEGQEQVAGDSTKPKPQQQPEIVKQEIPDSVLQAQFGFFANGKKGTEEAFILENEDVRISFSSKGGNVKEVTLKKHVSYDKTPLVLIDEQSSKIEEEWATQYGSIDFNSLFYQGKVDGNVATFTLTDGTRQLQRIYTLTETGYILNYAVNAQGLEAVLQQKPINFHWVNRMKRQEKDLPTSRMRTTVNFYTADESFDNLSETATEPESERLDQPAKWVSMKQKFFNSAIITDKTLTNVNVGIAPVAETDTSTLKIGEITASIPQTDLLGGSGNLRYYFGPNDLDICEAVAPGFDENVYLGWAIFVPISRYFIVPFFQFLENYITNYGIIILVLVFVVKMALFPLTYKSYLSMAKSRVLKPEMDKIKEEYGDDTQKIQQETLKVQSQFGVNPLSGCIPLLAQSPILFALFTFFPNAIQLRQESFLWADDLSTYDSILDLPFSIPMYGDHVSLFTLLMTAVTLINTFYNNQMNSSAANMQGPMKYVGYFMPVMFLFFLNSYSSGLTYYYFLSTSITVLQMVVSKQFINEDKIRVKLEENKKKNKGKKSGGFMSRMEKALREQEQVRKEQAGKTGGNSASTTSSKGAKNLKGKKRK